MNYRARSHRFGYVGRRRRLTGASYWLWMSLRHHVRYFVSRRRRCPVCGAVVRYPSRYGVGCPFCDPLPF